MRKSCHWRPHFLHAKRGLLYSSHDLFTCADYRAYSYSSFGTFKVDPASGRIHHSNG